MPTPDLKAENLSLKVQVRELTKTVTKLQRKVAKEHVAQLSAQALIKALKKEKLPPEQKPLSELEAARRIAFVLNRGGYNLVNGRAVQIRPPRKS